MKRAARFKTGSVVFDKRRKTWNFLWWHEGKRRSTRIGTHREYPTKASAWRAAVVIRNLFETPSSPSVGKEPTVNQVIDRYRIEKMPTRTSTRRNYEGWLRNHIVPKWGECPVTDLQARPVQLWLESLPLAPKSKAHIRGVLRILWDFAMWRNDLPLQRNPMEFVRVKHATKRLRQPRTLTADEFHSFIQHLHEPFKTIALLCCCLGLRISECLALKWGDVDWLNARLSVERAIVHGVVDDVKTDESRKRIMVDPELLEHLKNWKQTTQFYASDDWMFASPAKLGRAPLSYDGIWRICRQAAAEAGLGTVGTHSLRHTYRSWLDSVGTSVGVQQRLMRHADIQTTMNVYGDAVTEDMANAQAKVARLAFRQT
jgi:integrase